MMECCWTLTLSILAGVMGVWYLVHRNLNYFKRKGIPYVKGTPFLGNMGPVVFKKLCFAENVHRLYNMCSDVKYVGIMDFLSPVVMLRDPELVKSVAVKNFENFHDHKGYLTEKLDPLFAKMVFYLQGERWRETRTLLSPAFTSSRMKLMFSLISQCGDDLVDYLTTKTSRPVDLEMKDILGRYTNDVIASTAFGISVNTLKDRDNEFYVMGQNATSLRGIRLIRIFLIKTSPFLARLFGIRFLETYIDKFFNHVIGSTIAMRDEKGIVRNDMIQLMMQARDKDNKINLTVGEMTAQAFIFFFAGFETSSNLMSFAAHEIGTHPIVQEKLQAEIDQVLAENDGKVTYEALHNMRYLDQVINEAMRLYPPFAAIDRVCTKAFDLPPAAPGLKPMRVDVGQIVWFPCLGIHRDPAYFPDPDKFDPERFSEENKAKIPPSTYFPFGLGPRSCLGNRFALMEIKIAFFNLFAKFTFSPCSKTSIPMKFDKNNFNMGLENGFWLTVKRRSESRPGAQTRFQKPRFQELTQKSNPQTNFKLT